MKKKKIFSIKSEMESIIKSISDNLCQYDGSIVRIKDNYYFISYVKFEEEEEGYVELSPFVYDEENGFDKVYDDEFPLYDIFDIVGNFIGYEVLEFDKTVKYLYETSIKKMEDSILHKYKRLEEDYNAEFKSLPLSKLELILISANDNESLDLLYRGSEQREVELYIFENMSDYARKSFVSEVIDLMDNVNEYLNNYYKYLKK